MPTITFIAANGTKTTLDAPEGLSVMEVARENDVEGIAADCGGACACATCKVFVAPEWSAATGMPSDLEEAMLERPDGEDRHPRLSCQIRITPGLDGLVVHLPDSQY